MATKNTPSIAADRVLTLGEAVKITGFSAGKFRYQRDNLVRAGVVITDAGWAIPYRTLLELGWVGKKPAKGEVVDTPLSLAQTRIAELEEEVAYLRVELNKHSHSPKGIGRLFRR